MPAVPAPPDRGANARNAGDAPPRFDERFRTDLAALFAWRRDVRRFSGEALPRGTLEELVRSAASAPSVGFSQPSRYVSVETAERRTLVTAEFERANAEAAAAYGADDGSAYVALKLAGLREAPAHLAVYCDTATSAGRGLGRATMPEMLQFSVVLAVHTLWLTARARGIGVGWVSIVAPARISEILDVDPAWSLIAYLCIGYPIEEHADRELVRAGWEREREESLRILSR